MANRKSIGGLVVLLTIASTSCRPARTVRLGWDVPDRLPDGYRVFVDDRMVLDVPPPRADPSCSCLAVDVPVPSGRHTVSVVAYDRSGPSTPTVYVIGQ